MGSIFIKLDAWVCMACRHTMDTQNKKRVGYCDLKKEPCFCVEYRGNKAGSEAESDWVLPAQVLPAVWHQQSQISRCDCLPLQLQRPLILTRLLWEGDLCTVLPRNRHWGLTGNHGGQLRKSGFLHVFAFSLPSYYPYSFNKKLLL